MVPRRRPRPSPRRRDPRTGPHRVRSCAPGRSAIPSVPPRSRKPAAMDAGSVMSTLTPKASGLARSPMAATVSSRRPDPRHDGDPGPVRGEDLRHRPSHALAPPGHDGRGVSEAQIHLVLPPSSPLCRARTRCHRQNRLLTARRCASSVARRSPGVIRRAPVGNVAPISENGMSRRPGDGRRLRADAAQNDRTGAVAGHVKPVGDTRDLRERSPRAACRPRRWTPGAR